MKRFTSFILPWEETAILLQWMVYSPSQNFIANAAPIIPWFFHDQLMMWSVTSGYLHQFVSHVITISLGCLPIINQHIKYPCNVHSTRGELFSVRTPLRKSLWLFWCYVLHTCCRQWIIFFHMYHAERSSMFLHSSFFHNIFCIFHLYFIALYAIHAQWCLDYGCILIVLPMCCNALISQLINSIQMFDYISCWLTLLLTVDFI